MSGEDWGAERSAPVCQELLNFRVGTRGGVRELTSFNTLLHGIHELVQTDHTVGQSVHAVFSVKRSGFATSHWMTLDRPLHLSEPQLLSAKHICGYVICTGFSGYLGEGKSGGDVVQGGAS